MANPKIPTKRIPNAVERMDLIIGVNLKVGFQGWVYLKSLSDAEELKDLILSSF